MTNLRKKNRILLTVKDTSPQDLRRMQLRNSMQQNQNKKSPISRIKNREHDIQLSVFLGSYQDGLDTWIRLLIT